eukprot:400517-Pleurochrysis_carterae.AAC.1
MSLRVASHRRSSLASAPAVWHRPRYVRARAHATRSRARTRVQGDISRDGMARRMRAHGGCAHESAWRAQLEARSNSLRPQATPVLRALLRVRSCARALERSWACARTLLLARCACARLLEVDVSDPGEDGRVGRDARVEDLEPLDGGARLVGRVEEVGDLPEHLDRVGDDRVQLLEETCARAGGGRAYT